MNQNFAFALRPAFILCGLFGMNPVMGAQTCPEGELPFSMHIYTDAWGYEMYWELTAEGDACGTQAMYWGGNAEGVGCDGEGIMGAEEGSYASNATLILDTLCAVPGALVSLHHVDDFGDGGTYFEVYTAGALNHGFQGTGDGDVWTFNPFEASGPAYDSPCAALDIEVDGPMVLLQNDSCGAAFGEPGPPVLGCQTYGGWCEGGVARSAWLSFTATESNCYISACTDTTNFDTQLALWQVTDCADFDTYTLISANDDIPGGCGPGNVYASGMWTGCLNVGETYWIQLDGYYGSLGIAGVTIVSSDEEVSVSSSNGGLDCALGKEEEPDGNIVLNVAGSGSDYVTTWVGPNGFSGEGQQLSGIGGGTYSCVILTSCGSSLVHTVTLTDPTPISLDLELIGPDCPEQANGEAFLSATGGNAPYEIEWFGDQGTLGEGEMITGLGEGNYTVELEDGNGCATTLPFLLTADEETFSFSLGADTTICEEESLILSAPAGLTYLWSNGSVDQFIVFNGADLGPGTYPIIVEAANELGCSHADAIFITVFDCSTGIEGLREEGAIQVAPNPAQRGQSWAIEADVFSEANVTWNLLDGQGRLAKTGLHMAGSGKRIQVPADGLEAGQYMLLFPETGAKVRLIRQ